MKGNSRTIPHGLRLSHPENQFLLFMDGISRNPVSVLKDLVAIRKHSGLRLVFFH